MSAMLFVITAVLLIPAGDTPSFELSGHTGEVSIVCFSPDGARLYSGDEHGELICWDVSKRSLLWRS